MSHVFDDDASEQLIADAQRLVARSREHEQQLVRLVTLLEGDAHSAPWPTHLIGAIAASHLHTAATGPEIADSIDLLAFVRTVCVAARDQRQLIEAVVTGMFGELAVRSTHQVRVLVVDDSDDNRELAATVLEAAGFHPITARDGLEGVVAAHCERPAVVLMDITMPVLNGIEAARLLKASAATRHLNILAYTAKPEFYEGPFTRLFDDVLRKPTPPDAIIAAVRRFVQPESIVD